MNALETTGLSKRYGRTWALRDCTLAVPAGTVTALVGPNGAGKSTLLHLAVGLLRPSSGEVRVNGHRLSPRGPDLARVAFVAQDKPLYRNFTVAEMLHFGRATNPEFDTSAATARIQDYRIRMDHKVGRLSGGQHTLLALALALGKRASLLILDEPLANLDPLARHEVLGALMAATIDTGATVVLSSHILTELASTCDYLLLLNQGRLQLASSLDDLSAAHRIITGRADGTRQIDDTTYTIVQSNPGTALIRTSGTPLASGIEPDIDEIVLAYLRNPDASWLPAPALYGEDTP